MSLFLQKSTPDGRFTVSITSNTPESSLLLLQESARSLTALSDILSEASTLALTAAVNLLDAPCVTTGLKK
jgi:hypothetical protein